MKAKLYQSSTKLYEYEHHTERLAEHLIDKVHDLQLRLCKDDKLLKGMCVTT